METSGRIVNSLIGKGDHYIHLDNVGLTSRGILRRWSSQTNEHRPGNTTVLSCAEEPRLELHPGCSKRVHENVPPGLFGLGLEMKFAGKEAVFPRLAGVFASTFDGGREMLPRCQQHNVKTSRYVVSVRTRRKRLTCPQQRFACGVAFDLPSGLSLMNGRPRSATACFRVFSLGVDT